MGVYIKHLQVKKVEAIFKMLGLNIEDGDIVEVKTPHGRLIDTDDIRMEHKWCWSDQWWISHDEIETYCPTVIEAEVE